MKLSICIKLNRVMFEKWILSRCNFIDLCKENLFKIQGILFIIFYLIVNFIIEKNIFANIADWGNDLFTAIYFLSFVS